MKLIDNLRRDMDSGEIVTYWLKLQKSHDSTHILEQHELEEFQLHSGALS